MTHICGAQDSMETVANGKDSLVTICFAIGIDISPSNSRRLKYLLHHLVIFVHDHE